VHCRRIEKKKIEKKEIYLGQRCHRFLKWKETRNSFFRKIEQNRSSVFQCQSSLSLCSLNGLLIFDSIDSQLSWFPYREEERRIDRVI
jgi:hypothetical protein